MTLRKFGSRLEGHPTASFPYAEAATGSLGQGLSIGMGMALNAKYLDDLPYKTYVLLGDSEMAEGSQWESIQMAAHYKLDNLIGILDVNRLASGGKPWRDGTLPPTKKGSPPSDGSPWHLTAIPLPISWPPIGRLSLRGINRSC
jgi:hypothetical protein